MGEGSCKVESALVHTMLTRAEGKNGSGASTSKEGIVCCVHALSGSWVKGQEREGGREEAFN